ncbi:MAG: hypothetical protein LBR37_00615, partial [Erysipelotrichaceae bacterium]|nr:hypothetical protein [Erysipelotrichaceae bacterium]
MSISYRNLVANQLSIDTSILKNAKKDVKFDFGSFKRISQISVTEYELCLTAFVGIEKTTFVSAEFTVVFSFIDEPKDFDCLAFMKFNAVQFLFPFVRSAISNICV